MIFRQFWRGAIIAKVFRVFRVFKVAIIAKVAEVAIIAKIAIIAKLANQLRLLKIQFSCENFVIPRRYRAVITFTLSGISSSKSRVGCEV